MVGRNIALTLFVGAAIGLLLWKFAPAEWGPRQLAGLGMLIAGFILWTTARFQLGRSIAVTAQAKQLVTHGLYSRIRNPIYVFGSWVIAGTILAIWRPAGLLVLLALIPFQLWRARVESRVLEDKFGEEYRRYRAQTWL
jgi:protein-S-isoprenylcysteine O-methyltransferase Ste14